MSDFSDFDGFVLVGERYELTWDLLWDIGKRGSTWPLEIKAGTRFDLTVPRLLRWLQSPHDQQVLPAAAIHDELLNRGFDTLFAAAEFRRACCARGVGPWRAWALFFAVLGWTCRPAWMRSKKTKANGHG